MGLGSFARAARIGVAIAAVAACATASAETFTGDGYRLVVPSDFERAAPAFEEAMASQSRKQPPMTLTSEIDASGTTVTAFLHALEGGGQEVLTVLRIPGRPPPVDDAEFQSSFLGGVRRSLVSSPLSIVGSKGRDLRGGLRGFEVTLSGAIAGVGEVRAFSLTITRAAFVLSLSFVIAVGPGDDGHVRWDAVVAGLSTDAPAPGGPPRSLAYRIGRIAGIALVVALLVSWWVRSSRRRRDASVASPAREDPFSARRRSR